MQDGQSFDRYFKIYFIIYGEMFVQIVNIIYLICKIYIFIISENLFFFPFRFGPVPVHTLAVLATREHVYIILCTQELLRSENDKSKCPYRDPSPLFMSRLIQSNSSLFV